MKTVLSNFDSLINLGKPTVVEFVAEWCSPCKLMIPVLQEVRASAGDHIIMLQIDIDKEPELAARFGVLSVPALMIFRQGKMLWRANGIQPAKTIIQQLYKHQFL